MLHEDIWIGPRAHHHYHNQYCWPVHGHEHHLFHSKVVWDRQMLCEEVEVFQGFQLFNENVDFKVDAPGKVWFHPSLQRYQLHSSFHADPLRKIHARQPGHYPSFHPLQIHWCHGRRNL